MLADIWICNKQITKQSGGFPHLFTEKYVCDGLKGKRCATAAVVDVWHIANFTNNMISATAIRDKIEKANKNIAKFKG